MTNTSGEPAVLSTTEYGPFPTYIMARRASSLQATSLITLASTIFNSDYEAVNAAWRGEVTNTLVALGVWKGSA
jgi:hypothetical protein